jgi:hypothetical protein
MQLGKLGLFTVKEPGLLFNSLKVLEKIKDLVLPLAVASSDTLTTGMGQGLEEGLGMVQLMVVGIL